MGTEEIKNGLYESFHENGQLSKRENYKDGELDGLVEEFYESGQLNQRENYKDGELDGPWEWFYENGQLMTRTTFINGKKEGLLESFHSNGQLQMTENYKDNELDGLVEEFDENGELSIRENYKDGVLQDEDDEQTDDTSKDKKLDLSNLDTDFWGEILFSYADTLFDEILILDISQEDVINQDDSNIEEIGRIEYGNWDALREIISDENVALEKKSAESYIQQLRDDCELCDEVCECEHVISLASLYCGDQYIWGATNY